MSDGGHNSSHANNDQALLLASDSGHLEVVRLLLENGADIHANNDEALQWASENGHLEVVRLLICYNANIEVVNINDNNLLLTSNFIHVIYRRDFNEIYSYIQMMMDEFSQETIYTIVSCIEIYNPRLLYRNPRLAIALHHIISI